MKRLRLFIGINFLIFSLSSFVSHSQNLTCEDFQEGVFYATSSGSVQIKFKIIRKGNYQIEELLEIPEELKKEERYRKLDCIRNHRVD